MIRLIFCDVDGTLVSFRTHTIPASTLEALHALRAKGIKLFLATGRHQAMLRSVQELFPFDGCVTLSGQYCFVGSRVLRSSPMPPEAVEDGWRYVDFIRRNQERRIPFRLTLLDGGGVCRFNAACSVDEFEWKVKRNGDIAYSLTFREYRFL